MPEPTEREPLSAERWAEIRDIAGIDSDPHTYQQTVTLALRDVIGELHWTQDTLAAHLALESADAAAGSYAGRAEEAEAEVARLRGVLVSPFDAVTQSGRITGRELVRRIIAHPTWLDLPVHLLAMNDDAEWLNEIDYDCYEPDEGFVVALLAHEDRCPRATDSKARCGCVLAAKAMRELRAEKDVATARAKQAEAALAELRERLGETRFEWGVRTRDEDPDEDIEVLSSEAVAREFASTWRSEIPDANPTAMCRTARTVGPWRVADATPRTALERATDEQGVQPVRSVDEPGSAEFGDPLLTRRQDELLIAIRKERGDWSPARARDHFACLGWECTPRRAAEIMRDLARLGLLERTAPRAFTFRLKGEGGGHA